MFESAWVQMENELLRNRKEVPHELRVICLWAFDCAVDKLSMVLNQNLAPPLNMKLEKEELTRLQDAVRPSVVAWEECWVNPDIEDETIIGKDMGIPDEYIEDVAADGAAVMDSDSGSDDSDDSDS